MKESIIKEKSFKFAIRIVNMYKYMIEEKQEFVMSKQILRSGTSVGASVCEAEHSESKADFIHKMAISQKEINETLYWLELMKETNFISDKEFESINTDAVELIKMLTASIKTTKKSLTTNH
ncbi:MAG: four helix bundle protein [Prevotellaceae bacterium]|jgi:four helix bundle protein|nr:four helix bundle protein [Prevotellaceae bacterium]